jgi:ABC-type multidrug transport system fused ATPase/permease subunit
VKGVVNMQEFKKNIKHVKGYFKGQGFKVALVIILTALIFGLRVVTPIISAKIIVGITNSLFEQVIIIAIVLWGTEVIWNIIFH